jgi:3',5'-cyclic AMP phosphodiesterase CpdA
MALRLLHVSDLHFGRHSIAEQAEGARRMFASEKFDAIVVSGDFSQRARPREFVQAAEFVADARAHAPVLTVAGNHDTAWWRAPLGIGSVPAMHAGYREYVNEELEPVLHVPGATIVGLNSAQGLRAFTLTTRVRDLSNVGALRDEQWAKARREFDAVPAADLRVLVFHHNLLKGEISNRWGLASRARGIARAAGTGAQLVLNGHDHQAAFECLDIEGRRMVVACASTLTDRVRGGGPGAVNMIEVDEKTVQVDVLQWDSALKSFARVMWARYAR